MRRPIRDVSGVARSVYITGLEPGGGKSTVALGVAELLSRRVGRLAVFRPLVRDGAPIRSSTCSSGRYQAPAGTGRRYQPRRPHWSRRPARRPGRRDRASATADSTGDADAVVIVGTDFGRDTGESGELLPDELAFNARLATELGTVVLPVVDGPAGRRPSGGRRGARGVPRRLSDLDATVAAVIANRVAPDAAHRWSRPSDAAGARCTRSRGAGDRRADGGRGGRRRSTRERLLGRRRRAYGRDVLATWSAGRPRADLPGPPDATARW